MKLGIIEREFSVDAGIKEHTNSRRGIYHLTDHFFRFWYACGFANISQLESRYVDDMYEYIIAPALHKFVALPFEEIVCTPLYTRRYCELYIKKKTASIYIFGYLQF
jgi:hypothetical protein